MFMAFIVLSYILWISPRHGGPFGFGLDLVLAYGIGAILTITLAAWVFIRAKKAAKPQCEPTCEQSAPQED